MTLPVGTIITGIGEGDVSLTDTAEYEPGELLAVAEDGVITTWRIHHPEYGVYDLPSPEAIEVEEDDRVKCPTINRSFEELAARQN